MKNKIIKEYYKNIFLSVSTIIILWVVITFLLLFNNKAVDVALPQYLALSFEQYVTISDDGVQVNGAGITELKKHDLWLQILDENGVVIYNHNVPSVAKLKYSHTELLHYVLESDRMEGYTLYAVPVEEYTIIIAGNSDLVQKISYDFIGNGADVIFQSFMILLMVMFIVIIVVGFLFSKKISAPVSEILMEIDAISQGKNVENPKYKKSLFAEVFIQIQILQKRLKENQLMRNEWISNISHDIKTPLSSIKGYAEVLGEYNLTKEEIVLYSKEISKSEQSIEVLLDELTLNQKLAEGKIVLNLTEIDIVSVLSACILEIQKHLDSNNNIELIAPDSLNVMLDKDLIKRCFGNILSNAFIHNDKLISIEVEVIQQEHYTEVIIKDNGKGMSEEDLSQIFERYYRGTASQTTIGTGLGLAIAKEVILAHGGQISVRSKPYEGVIFNIKL